MSPIFFIWVSLFLTEVFNLVACVEIKCSFPGVFLSLRRSQADFSTGMRCIRTCSFFQFVSLVLFCFIFDSNPQLKAEEWNLFHFLVPTIVSPKRRFTYLSFPSLSPTYNFSFITNFCFILHLILLVPFERSLDWAQMRWFSPRKLPGFNFFEFAAGDGWGLICSNGVCFPYIFYYLPTLSMLFCLISLSLPFLYLPLWVCRLFLLIALSSKLLLLKRARDLAPVCFYFYFILLRFCTLF